MRKRRKSQTLVHSYINSHTQTHVNLMCTRTKRNETVHALHAMSILFGGSLFFHDTQYPLDGIIRLFGTILFLYVFSLYVIFVISLHVLFGVVVVVVLFHFSFRAYVVLFPLFPSRFSPLCMFSRSMLEIQTKRNIFREFILKWAYRRQRRRRRYKKRWGTRRTVSGVYRHVSQHFMREPTD